jgi:hypothetical protein
MAGMTAARYAACLAVLLAACAAQHWEKAGSNVIDFDSASEREFERMQGRGAHRRMYAHGGLPHGEVKALRMLALRAAAASTSTASTSAAGAPSRV